MLRIFWTSKSAIDANSKKMDQISYNIANEETNGFKKIDVNFKDLVYEAYKGPGYPLTKKTNGDYTPMDGTGALTSDPVTDNSQGELQGTGYKSDLAIDGPGYITVSNAKNGLLYARVGSYQPDADGRLVDANQNILNIKFDKGYSYNNLKFTQDGYTIKENGDVFIGDEGSGYKVGKLEIFNAIGDNSFQYVGAGLYSPTKGAQIYKETNSHLEQGFSETSNVNLIDEETSMITTQRAFQLAARSLKTADDMLQIANNLTNK